MPKARARRATAAPMRPGPTMPSVRPARSRPRSQPGSHGPQPPSRTAALPSGRRRAAASSSASVRSAVASVSTPGVFVTSTPRAVAAPTSTLSKPTAMLATTRSPGQRSSSASSTRSVSIVRIPEQGAARSANSSAVGGARLRPDVDVESGLGAQPLQRRLRGEEARDEDAAHSVAGDSRG